MKLAGIGKLMAMLYDDRMDIYRTIKQDNDDRTVDISYEPEPLYRDVPCRLSFSGDDTATEQEVDHNPVRFNPKLFFKSQEDVRAGDYVVVTRYADDGSAERKYEGTVAQPSWYSTHQEAFMRIDEGA